MRGAAQRMKGAARLVLLLVPAAAWAQDRPALTPTRDVDVVYHAANIEQRMRWLAAGHKLRIDPPGAGMFMIVDYDAHRMEMVRPADRKAVSLPSPGGLPGMAGPAGAAPAGAYVRRGTETVAGLPCTDWDTTDNGGSTATVCFTADGVMLRASRNGTVLVEAASVAYRAQDPADFLVPPGFQVLTPPPPTPP